MAKTFKQPGEQSDDVARVVEEGERKLLGLLVPIMWFGCPSADLFGMFFSAHDALFASAAVRIAGFSFAPAGETLDSSHISYRSRAHPRRSTE